MDRGAIEMGEFSPRPAKVDESRHIESDRKTLRWARSVRDSAAASHRIPHRSLNTSISSTPSPRRRQKAADHLFVDSPTEKMSPSFPRWLVSCGRRTIDPNADEYQVESWSSFHKKYSSHSFRTAHSMTFSEIRKQQRRKVTPSLTERILKRLSGHSSKCVNCGAAQCDGSCSMYTTHRSKKHSNAPKNKKSLSPFGRKSK